MNSVNCQSLLCADGSTAVKVYWNLFEVVYFTKTYQPSNLNTCTDPLYQYRFYDLKLFINPKFVNSSKIAWRMVRTVNYLAYYKRICFVIMGDKTKRRLLLTLALQKLMINDLRIISTQFWRILNFQKIMSDRVGQYEWRVWPKILILRY